MAILNVTYNGLSADYALELDAQVSDADIRRIALELVRTGGLVGLHVPNLGAERLRRLRDRPAAERPADLPAAEGAVRRVRPLDRARSPLARARLEEAAHGLGWP